jgi:hypothetical protein
MILKSYPGIRVVKNGGILIDLTARFRKFGPSNGMWIPTIDFSSFTYSSNQVHIA